MVALLRSSAHRLLFGLLFVAAFAWLFWPTFVWMAERFDAHDSFYSHGWLIPLASAWLVWQRRETLSRLTPHASYWGLALLIPSVAVHVLASWLALHFVSGFAMIAASWGVVWTIWGRQTVWALRFPLLFLLFMVPLPGVLLISVSFRMKLLAATMATRLLAFAGLPALQEGSTIQLPGASVIVDDTCSGLRSLISLIALSILWTSLMGASSKRWQKLTIVAASIPIALAANMIRILALALVSAIYGPKAAESFIHYGSGIVVFGMALVSLAWLSHRLVKPPQPTGGRAS